MKRDILNNQRDLKSEIDEYRTRADVVSQAYKWMRGQIERLIMEEKNPNRQMTLIFLYCFFDPRINQIPPLSAIEGMTALVDEAENIENFEQNPAVRAHFFQGRQAEFERVAKLFIDFYRSVYRLSDAEMRLPVKPNLEKNPGTFLAVLENFTNLKSGTCGEWKERSQKAEYCLNFLQMIIEEAFAAICTKAPSSWVRNDFNRLPIAFDVLDKLGPRDRFLDIYPNPDNKEIEPNIFFMAVRDAITDVNVPSSYKMAHLLCGRDSNLGQNIPGLAAGTWEKMADDLFTKIRTESNREMTSAVTEMELGGEKITITIDPPANDFYPYALISGNILLSNNYDDLVKSGRLDRKELAPVYEERIRRLSHRLLGGTFAFHINQEGKLIVAANSEKNLVEVMGKRNYEAVRMHVLYFLASLTVSKYKFKPLSEVEQILKDEIAIVKPAGPKKPIDLPRERIIRTLDEIREPLAVEDNDEKDYRLHYAGEHKRLLAVGKPSHEKFYQALDAATDPTGTLSGLKAFIINPTDRTIVNVVEMNQSQYSDYVEAAKQLEKQEKNKGNAVRFETYVGGHFPKSGETPEGLVVRIRRIQKNIEKGIEGVRKK